MKCIIFCNCCGATWLQSEVPVQCECHLRQSCSDVDGCAQFMRKGAWVIGLKDRSSLLPPANEVWGQSNVFTPVCQSFCSHGGVCPIACWETHPLRQTPPIGRHSPPGQTPPPPRILRYTINKQAVRILLECLLVLTFSDRPI